MATNKQKTIQHRPTFLRSANRLTSPFAVPDRARSGPLGARHARTNSSAIDRFAVGPHSEPWSRAPVPVGSMIVAAPTSISVPHHIEGRRANLVGWLSVLEIGWHGRFFSLACVCLAVPTLARKFCSDAIATTDKPME